MKIHFSIYLLAFFLFACTDNRKHQGDAARVTAGKYCGSCHVFPEPALLDRRTWKEDVLPAMAKQLGIDHQFEMPLPNAKAGISIQEWKQVLQYYLQHAPLQMPAQGRVAISSISTQFTARAIPLDATHAPATSFIQIDEKKRWILAADALDSSLYIFTKNGGLVSHTRLHAAVVNVAFDSTRNAGQTRKGVFTDIGKMNPNDELTGSARNFALDAKGRLTILPRRVDGLQRPVQVTPCDLDQDGVGDLLICAFGNNSGKLYWMKGAGERFEDRVLSPLPGAIKAIVTDFDRDGRPDVLALMTQAREGITWFKNMGSGQFETIQLLNFPPVYGSSNFELHDFNRDGLPDLLYTCGDNDDYSSRALKNYHGVYIFLNNGHQRFRQSFFYPIHGCYKAMAKDFDHDGDLDIAAISFFPDSTQPQEALVYLEQTGKLQFRAATVDGYAEGRWMTMDAGDLDGDGFDDIVLGSLIPPTPSRLAEWRASGRQRTRLLILHNTGRAKSK